MAINKAVGKPAKSHGGLRNTIEYVLKDEKVREGYLDVIGPYLEPTVNYDAVYRAWLEEKKLWDKDSGRMCAHNVISFHKDEQVTPAEVLEIGRAFTEEFFSGHQSLIAVHQDRDHLHCHIVTNSVSYIDGRKLHQSKKDLEQQKVFTNNLCRERGLHVAEKGHHFDGTPIESGEIITWNKNTYKLLTNDSKKSFLADCGITLMEVIPKSASKEEFISGMAEKGWSVKWEDKRKHIVFENENGDKVRDSKIEKTFAGLHVNKEALTNEFERQKEIRLSDNRADEERESSAELIPADFERYYAEVESAIAGLGGGGSVEGNTGAESSAEAEGRNDRGPEESDTDRLVREVRFDICNSRSQSRDILRADRESAARDRERQLEEQRRTLDQERAAEARRRTHHHSGPSL
ncbi:relaxase/mobilization nuclease domain-containing protein [Butyrivibrio sp. INlla16]|uniref:relaxase/mobilization nuclease domain-containing protein n=1 Tax=Butyrivibrio sp. INlla16 TaxID=1520807 RepID=UPI00088BEF8B|nr:relaxase/mobilization nuclease domain-containing protein [Butyrivibrio sp. INlla16]SDB61416.1 Relaxase/Mobilisation nuclease domain-containing protein [Butyrivibrio sp. INlla16]